SERYKRFMDYFSKKVTLPETELKYCDPFGLLVAVILSAQCTDKRVNMITPELLRAFPDAEAMAGASQEQIVKLIKSCSYPNSKARNLIGMAKMLREKFGGKVPEDPELLQQLPGVGRKTANVVASVLFVKPVIAVDTHVFRVSVRLGLAVNARTPLEAERRLVRYIPPSMRHNAHHWLILHGRYICKARKPLCEKCGLTSVCKYFNSRKRKNKSDN
ncbi:MAG: endonuclease III, partial [Bacteroidales bacterium]